MNLSEILTEYENAKSRNDNVTAFLRGKELIDKIESEIESTKQTLENTMEVGKYNIDNCSKQLVVLMLQKANLDKKVIDELSDEEIRKTYKVTETSLKSLKRQDLIDKYKRITEVKQIKVESISD